MFASIALLTAGALVFVSAGVQHFNTIGSRGLGFVFTDRTTPLSREGFAGRAARTLQNNLESAGMVVPSLVLLLMLGVNNTVVATAAGTYAAVRIGFTFSYWIGIHKLRSFFWGVGMAMIAILTVSAAMAVLTLGA